MHHLFSSLLITALLGSRASTATPPPATAKRPSPDRPLTVEQLQRAAATPSIDNAILTLAAEQLRTAKTTKPTVELDLRVTVRPWQLGQPQECYIVCYRQALRPRTGEPPESGLKEEACIAQHLVCHDLR